MKTTLFAVLLLSCGLTLRAQDPVPADKNTAAAAAIKPAAQPKAASPRAAARPAKTVKPAAAVSAQAQQTAKEEAAAKADSDADESVVMIDSKADIEDTGRFSAASGREQDEPAVSGGIPASYGQCKGVVNDGGRSLLVFESAEDGTISFVQVAAGKSKVAWKLVDRIPRSAD